MSKISISGAATGTATFTIESPATNTNRTLTLPDASGTMVVTGGAQTIEFAAGTAGAPSITTTGDTNTGIFFPAADTIAFAEGGAEAMRIDSSGNVGIGTTSPAKPLHVSGGSSGGTFPTDTILAIEDNDGTTLSLLGGTSSILGITLGDSADNDRFKIECNTTSGSRYMAFTVDASERMRIDSSGNLLFNSGYGSVATAYGCRAWVTFNGTGTPAISEDGNVSSITDHGTGDYTVNFTNAMPDANYSVNTMNYLIPGVARYTYEHQTIAAGSIRIGSFSGYGGPFVDAPRITVSIFR